MPEHTRNIIAIELMIHEYQQFFYCVLMHTYKSRGYLYWSEGINDAMYRSNMDGSNIELLLNTSVDVIGKHHKADINQS